MPANLRLSDEHGLERGSAEYCVRTVRDSHIQKEGVLLGGGVGGELGSPMHILHRIDAVHHEVHQHLLQLHAISHDLREVCTEFRPNEYGESRCLAVKEKHHLSNNLV